MATPSLDRLDWVLQGHHGHVAWPQQRVVHGPIALDYTPEDMGPIGAALEWVPFRGRHVGKNMEKVMEVILERLGISARDIEGAVTDNASDVSPGLHGHTDTTHWRAWPAPSSYAPTARRTMPRYRLSPSSSRREH